MRLSFFCLSDPTLTHKVPERSSATSTEAMRKDPPNIVGMGSSRSYVLPTPRYSAAS